MDTKKKAVITARVDLDTKERARKVFENAGLDMTTAINIYLKKAIAVNGVPFSVTAIDPLDEATLRAHDEIQRGEYDSFDSVDAWFKDLTNGD
ncbi:type II toxin-antitoxin system RelB/DinJ family antitoxin [Lapidilactobacillus luobeiensis]|uniref:type II toxin-antitoxin system RelB/DinJ family antitoxin n=1 Tax=Lapidilactobacillus luobeiensis TaxID=2950371 RepID=UPI0021C444A4|nr:type II toxin-antitoxin system RelB/DinJ family antitoxin [Lapidilactobacillus luobeiensis]